MYKLSAFADEAAKDLEGQIAALKRNRIPLLEIRNIDGVNVKDFTESYAKEVARVLSDHGIGISAIGSPLGKEEITLDFPRYLDTVKRVCETACLLSADRIRMFSFFHAEKERDTVIDYLGQMVEVAKSYGVSLCHENEKEIYGDTLSRVLDLLDNVKGLECIYDPANFVQCGEDTKKTLAVLQDRTVEFHIKDCLKAGGEIVPAGYGDGNIADIVKAANGRVLTLEPHLFLFEGYASIDSTELRHRFTYQSNAEAFDAAVTALRAIAPEEA